MKERVLSICSPCACGYEIIPAALLMALTIGRKKRLS